MKIYLVRHAGAVERSEAVEEGTRWLTVTGRKTMRKAASRLRKMRVRPGLIITSPLTRAVQTAELLMAAVGSHAELVADNLLSEGTAEQLQELILSINGDGTLMLVGHEPLLSQTAALLLGRGLSVSFAKGGCLYLELRTKPGKPAKFKWYAAPSGKVLSSVKKAVTPV